MRSRLDEMTRLKALMGALSVVAVMLAAPRLAAAAPPSAPATEVARLEAECARLRSELDRANADVTTLKRADRSVRADYRLRQRMADAEALARKLTEAEAQLRGRQGAPVPSRAPALAPPSAAPGDGPVELAAKAALLSDQAHRLMVEADGLARNARELRGRQLLNRRVSQLERDPFAGLESSKRTIVFAGSRASTLKPSGDSAGGSKNVRGAPVPSSGHGDSADTGTRGTGGASGASGGSTAGQSGGSTGGTGGGTSGPSNGTTPPMAAPGASAPGAAPPPATPPQTTTTQPSHPPTVEVSGPPPQPTSALSSQLRTLLDPATLSQFERLERTGRPITDPEALEKLAAALRQRAQALDGQARDLRTRARP